MNFIGGTGRSGTTILAKILGNHSKCYVFPTELRFITDPDGLISLKNALVDDWSFFNGDIAIERFITLMKALSNRFWKSYPNSDLKSMVGKEFYFDWLNNYVSEINYNKAPNLWAARANLFRKVIVKVFGINKFTSNFLESSFFSSPLEEEDFYKISGKFVRDFFNRAASINKKEFCIDHTPSNLIHADFLQELFPDLKLLHIFRDPLDVISSFSGKDWGSNNIEVNTRWIFETYKRWEQVKTIISPENYFELSFEKLIYYPKETMSNVCEFMNLKYEDSMINLDLSKHNIGRWEQVLSIKDIENINNKYGNLVELYRNYIKKI